MLQNDLEESAAIFKSLMGDRLPRIGLILGSGLNPLAEMITESSSISFCDIPHMKASTAQSHVGRFVCGKLADKQVFCMQGRLHGYEGNSSQEVVYPVWLMAQLGVTTVITTNAAGAINESYHVGDFCIMKDHINFTGRNPIADAEPAAMAQRFFSMADAYDQELRDVAFQVARDEKVCVHEGVFLGVLGPSFETPAEIRMFRNWGADTVAMSVVEEVIAARHRGMRVLGLSLISNMACGINGASPDEDEVLDVASERQAEFSRLITGIVSRL